MVERNLNDVAPLVEGKVMVGLGELKEVGAPVGGDVLEMATVFCNVHIFIW